MMIVMRVLLIAWVPASLWLCAAPDPLPGLLGLSAGLALFAAVSL